MKPNDTIDRWRIAVAIACLIFFAALIVGLSGSDRTAKPMPINGDTLGPDITESMAEYTSRAQQSLEQQLRDNPEANGYALVSFARPLDVHQAGELLENQLRVNAIQVADRPMLSLPEPIAGKTRSETFAQQLESQNLTTTEIHAAVVWARYVDVEKLTESGAVLVVEVLPPDAWWQGFSVKPVDVVGQKYTTPQPAK